MKGRIVSPLARRLLAVLFALVLVVPMAPAADAKGSARLTPIVFVPGWHATTMVVTVHHQTAFPECPESGTFLDTWATFEQPPFTQVCRDKLVTLVYDPDPRKPMSKRFSNQPGVQVKVYKYGTTESVNHPWAQEMFTALESVGYQRNVNIRAAGIDHRLTPDMGGFLESAKKLIQETYRENGNTPVHLVAHSNGPLYAQYLLTHTSKAWKQKYIHGFTPIAGNWGGVGWVYSILFTGNNMSDFTRPSNPENARSSAEMWLSHPSTYITLASPSVIGDREVVIKDLSTDTEYTPRDALKLLGDAGRPQSREIAAYYLGFVKSVQPVTFPNVDVYAEYGSGLPNVVGMKLPNLTVGQPMSPTPDVYVSTGDGSMEVIGSKSIKVWEGMPCYHFTLTENAGVDHNFLVSDPGVIQRLLANLQRPRSACR